MSWFHFLILYVVVGLMLTTWADRVDQPLSTASWLCGVFLWPIAVGYALFYVVTGREFKGK